MRNERTRVVASCPGCLHPTKVTAPNALNASTPFFCEDMVMPVHSLFALPGNCIGGPFSDGRMYFCGVTPML